MVHGMATSGWSDAGTRLPGWLAEAGFCDIDEGERAYWWVGDDLASQALRGRRDGEQSTHWPKHPARRKRSRAPGSTTSAACRTSLAPGSAGSCISRLPCAERSSGNLRSSPGTVVRSYRTSPEAAAPRHRSDSRADGFDDTDRHLTHPPIIVQHWVVGRHGCRGDQKAIEDCSDRRLDLCLCLTLARDRRHPSLERYHSGLASVFGF
jgi:hypothetical protein